MQRICPSLPKRFSAIAVILAGLMAVLGPSSCTKADHSAPLETIRIAAPPLEQNALFYVADEKRFFIDQGLRIVMKDYDSGVTAINGMLAGEAEMAQAAEFPFVRTVFEKTKIRLITCTDRFENDYLVGRKERGIKGIADLKGKRIGVALHTINEFYLGRFLAMNGIDTRRVTLVDLKPAQYVTAMAGGDVDAIIAWEPYVDRIKKDVSGIVVWPAQSSQAAYGVLMCATEWLNNHSETVQRLLKSLRKGEEHLVRHEDEAKAIVRKRLNYSESYLASVWPKHQFSLFLDQTLIVAMKDEAQWMINNRLTGETGLPDFADYVFTDALKAVKPEGVKVIH
jgi:NitT/TauT family transport system substrate-binding protein